VTGIDYLAKVTLVENQSEAIFRHVNLQRNVRSPSENYKRFNRVCYLVLYRIGARLVSWGTGLQKRFGTLADASV
jgi:hypothetical protein